MAELILSPEEEDMDLLQFSDESLGKAVKRTFIALVDAYNQENKDNLFLASCAHILCYYAHKINSTETTLKVEGLVYDGKPIGNYAILIEKKEE